MLPTKADPEINAKDVKRLILKAYRGYKRGELTESQAYRETYILSTLLKAIELTDVTERLARVEEAMRGDD